MKQLLFLFITAAFLNIGCSEQDDVELNSQEFDSEYSHQITPKVISQLTSLGFNPDGIEVVEAGYRIERDIIITPDFLDAHDGHDHTTKGNEKQFSTNALVSTNGSRVIRMYISAPGCSTTTAVANNGSTISVAGAAGVADMGRGNGGGNNGGGGNGGDDGGNTQFDQSYANALDDAIGRFNAENLDISFERVCDPSQADISFSRLSRRDERRGILGSAGFPSSGGDPFDQIDMSGVIISNFGWSEQALATVMAHEMGHCIGFRHTDFYDRSISCGGQTSNEGTTGIGANHIPGTPNVGEVQESDASWMLACTGNINRPFNAADKTALDFLY